MRIAQLVSNLNPVSRESTKAICSHVALLTNTIVQSGHQADLYAAGDSVTKGTLHSISQTAAEQQSFPPDLQRHFTNMLISDCYKNAADYDIIHSHFTLLSSFYAGLVNTPTLISVHSPIRTEIHPFLLKYRQLSYVSFSHAQRHHMPELNWVANIYHGVDTERFAFHPFPKDYFLYLGRVTEEKGVHHAIEAAKAAKVPLIIAGGSYQAEGYWHKNIEPEINGKTIRYVGVANETQKIELLQNARALLFPTQYDETFGLVMIEAMACGTPVIGWRNGSVPEVVADNVTGFIVDSVYGMVKAIESIDTISRQATRKRAETYFSQQKMTEGYLRVYERMIKKNKKITKPPATQKKSPSRR
ncbi:MAG: glycosyltransferase family 4 protein [Patescibacteria group bacterium]